MKFAEVGTKLKAITPFRVIRLKVVADTKDIGCKACFYSKHKTKCPDFECRQEYRQDKTNVIFKQIN